MMLYHATSYRNAKEIEEDGFRGNDVWDHKDVVFLADRPLPGFGGYGGEAWVAVEVPEDVLRLGEYDESFWDNDQYSANCYCFPAKLINKFSRKIMQTYDYD